MADADPCPGRFIEFARTLPQISRPIVLQHFRAAVAVEQKADDSPVTVADRDAEAALRAAIEGAFPDHGILGEEHGEVRLDAEHVWVLDPIDGTRAFISGIPMFGTMVALCRNGVPILGLIDLAGLNETWVGATGHPTLCNDRPVHARACAALDESTLVATTPEMFEEGDDRAAFARVRNHIRYLRFGTDCVGYTLVAGGWVDFACETMLEPYDYLAHVPVVLGAGGAMTGWDGSALTLESGETRALASGDPARHDELLRLLQG